jgi:hypothetical protein
MISSSPATALNAHVRSAQVEMRSWKMRFVRSAVRARRAPRAERASGDEFSFRMASAESRHHDHRPRAPWQGNAARGDRQPIGK